MIKNEILKLIAELPAETIDFYIFNFNFIFIKNIKTSNKMGAQGREIKQELEEVIGTLPRNKLAEVVDFAKYLKEKECSKESKEILKMQVGSKAYKEWAGSDNDIYDELFKDEID